MDERFWLKRLLSPLSSDEEPAALESSAGNRALKESTGNDLTMSHPRLSVVSGDSSGPTPPQEPRIPLWLQAFPGEPSEGLGDALETLRELYPSRVAGRMEASIDLAAWPKSRAAVSALRQERLKGLASAPTVAAWIALGLPAEPDRYGVGGLREGAYALSDWRSIIREELHKAEDDLLLSLMRLEGFFDAVVEPMMCALLQGEHVKIQRAAVHYLRHNAVHTSVAIEALSTYIASPLANGDKDHAFSHQDAGKAIDELRFGKKSDSDSDDFGQNALSSWDDTPSVVSQNDARTSGSMRGPFADSRPNNPEKNYVYNLPQSARRRDKPPEIPRKPAPDTNTLTLEEGNHATMLIDIDDFESQHGFPQPSLDAEPVGPPAQKYIEFAQEPKPALTPPLPSNEPLLLQSTDEVKPSTSSFYASPVVDDNISNDLMQVDISNPQSEDDRNAQMEAALMALARDAHPEVRVAALDGLSTLGAEQIEASSLALEASRDTSPEVRMAAARLLAQLLQH